MSSSLTTTNNQGVFAGIQQFEEAQRIAKALASSQLVPKEYQGQQGLPNVLVAMEISGRMGLGPLQVMQNLHIVNGRPSWSSQFIIATINGCGRFTPLDYIVTGEGDAMTCQAVAIEIKTSKELKGPVASIAMAKREGWYSKNGSKWQTMPDLMLRYRAAAFWGRVFAPEYLVGMKTQEEVIEIEAVDVSSGQDLMSNKPAQTAVEQINAEIENVGEMDDSDW